MATKRQRFYTVRMAAERLTVSMKTIRNWAQKKILPGIKIGPRGDWRFTQDDLASIISQRKEVKTHGNSR